MTRSGKKIINILLVEDNPVDVRMAQETLKRCQMYQCKATLAGSLAEAKKQLASKKPDAILLDLGLPDSDGLETFVNIKEAAPGIPVVILSASGDRDSARAAIRDGAKDYLIKSPESYEFLDRAIRYAVEAGRIEKIVSEGTEKLQEVSEAAVALADIGLDEDIYAIIAKSMKSLSGAMITHISIVKENKLLSIQYIDGLPGILKKASSLLGVPLEGVEFEMNDDIFTDLLSGKSHITDNLSKAIFISFLSPGKLSKIQRLLGIGEILFLPLRYKNTLVGICSVVYNKNVGLGTHLTQFLKVFTDAAAIALEQRQTHLQLAESEEKYRNVVEHANDGILIVQDGIIIYANDRTAEIRGRSQEEIIGNPFINGIAPEYLSLVDDYYSAVMRGEEVVPRFEIEIITSQGQRTTVDVNASLIEHEGRPAVLALLRDITEHKLATVKIENVAAELRLLIETANAPIIGIDTDGMVNEWNEAIVALTGFAKDEVLGRNLVETRISDDYRASVKAVLDMALNGEETANYEFPLYTSKGERVMVLLNASSRRDVQGNIVGVLGIGQDITELDKYRTGLEEMVVERTAELNLSLAETELARSRIDGILKSIGDGLIVTDMRNRVVLMNRAVEDMLGVRLSEVIDQPIELAIKEKSLREQIVTTLAKKTTGTTFDFDLPDAESEYPRIMRARTSVIFNREGLQSGIITIIHDVSHEREVDRMKTEFISTAAHELRTPLTSIQGFSEILMTRNDLEEGEREKFLGHINRQATALAEIINDLLNISRIEFGREFALNLEACDAGEAIQSVMEPFMSRSKDHSFKVSLPEKSQQLVVDKAKMAQLLENLVSNAIKYSPAGSEIKVSGVLRKGWYDVIVEDAGIGMTHEQLGHIYEKFYRADSSNTAIAGTGLGMSIAKAIIDAHGGHIDIVSEVGVGTKVTISLPIPVVGPTGGKVAGEREENEKLGAL